MKTIEKDRRRKTFDQKMIILISSALMISSIIIMLIAVSSSLFATVNQSRKLAEEKVRTMIAGTEGDFERYEGIFWTVLLNQDIQNFLRDNDRYTNPDATKHVLDNVRSMWDNMNFVAVIDDDNLQSSVSGKIPYLKNRTLYEKVQEELKKGMRISKKATGKRVMTYNSAFTKEGEYSLTLYQPIYSTSILNKKIGTVCISIDDINLANLMEEKTDDYSGESYFLYGDGTVVASNNKKVIGTGMNMSRMREREGYYWSNGYLNIYKWMDQSNYLYLTKINLYRLCEDNFKGIALMIIVVLFLMVIFQMAAGKSIRKAYQPWLYMAETMDQISKGALDTRLELEEPDLDMERIVNGFNVMMDRILQLMEQMTAEQRQMDQIKLDALQSQIQPHFLYNTLDCIRWQAVMEGNKELAKMIKSLAAYYRICLSKGREIISLGKELEHIRNYMYIQHMRYGEVFTYEILEQEWVEQVEIPKLTLQPLVENSIYHGIKIKEGKTGLVQITVERKENYAIIKVKDNGEGMSDEKIKEMNQSIQHYEETMGYGVRNVNRRIELMFGKEYGLYYESNEEGGVTVTVKIPYENQNTMKPIV